jgi:hypothetical protein
MEWTITDREAEIIPDTLIEFVTAAYWSTMPRESMLYLALSLALLNLTKVLLVLFQHRIPIKVVTNYSRTEAAIQYFLM